MTLDITVDGNLTNVTTPAGTDRLIISSSGVLKDVTLATLQQSFFGNYKLSVTVSSNDLIVALVHEDGTAPSTDRPLYFKINNTLRIVSAATSITIVDGTSWFGAGSATIGGNPCGFFPYLVWDSNSSIVAISISRIPYGRLVSDFSGTTTNEKHLYNYANFTTTDDVVNIGYFEATLSLVATSHLWTVATFTSANLINSPTFVTNWLSFNFNPTNLTVGDGTVNYSRYRVIYDLQYFENKFTLGSTSAVGTSPIYAPPFSVSANPVAGLVPLGGATFKVAAGGYTLGNVASQAATQILYIIYITSGASATLSGLTSTVPFTWATGDYLASHVMGVRIA